MLLSDKIANDTKILGYFKTLGIEDYRDIFNDAWLRIREQELRGKDFSHVRNHFSFFITVFRNVMIDNQRRNKLDLVYGCDFNRVRTEVEEDVLFNFDNWINSESATERELLNKMIIELVSKTETKTEAINMTLLSRDKFYKLFNEAKKIFIDECT